jgi:hypothetical protein
MVTDLPHFFPYTQIGISTSTHQTIPGITTPALGLLLDFAGGPAFFELGFDRFAKAVMGCAVRLYIRT